MINVTAGQIEAVRAISEDFNRAVLADDNEIHRAKFEQFRALVAEANGPKGEFGSFAPDGAGRAIVKALETTPGDIPHWGQNGLFILNTVHGRAMVKFRSGLDTLCGFSFHAVDLGRDFVSETGFLSSLLQGLPAMPVNEAAEIAYCAEVERRGLKPIQMEYRNRRAEEMPAFAKATDASFQGVPLHTSKEGQMGFAF
ncbi:hypothetical protein [Marinomonas sp.]|uniref:hypothetical protein n=1 Tax=Marinomonas sp. TaxID=1904862 RepID=UPI003A900DFA